MKFLFLSTHFKETLLEKTQLYCLAHGIEVVRINIEDLLPNATNTVQVTTTAHELLLTVQGKTHRLREFSLVWKRRISDNYFSVDGLFHAYKDRVPSFVCQSLLREIQGLRDLIVHFARHLAIPILNDYDLTCRSKPFQTVKAVELGLRTPAMMVSNVVSSIQDFFPTCEAAITKPIGGVGYFEEGGHILSLGTSDLDLAYTEQVTTPSIFPSLVQERIPSAYELKCLLVGDELFCIKQYCEEGDIPTTDIKSAYRANQITNTAYQLHDVMKDKVIQLCHFFQLDLCTLDIIKSTAGEYVFLEINPDGVIEYYSYFLPISIHEHIFKLLLQKSNP